MKPNPTLRDAFASAIGVEGVVPGGIRSVAGYALMR